MKAYKMFNKDMTCTHGHGIFQYEIGKTYYEPEANCAKNGFHCAENPLDCLNYYHDFSNAVCCEVEAGGSIDEDDRDTKISCTKLTILKQLDMEEFLVQSMLYMVSHPQMPLNSRVRTKPSGVTENHFVIVRSNNPIAKGKAGDFVCLLKEDDDGQILEAGIYEIDEELEDTWINVFGEVASYAEEGSPET